MKDWRELYDKLPAERRAKIEAQVMHDLEEMRLIDRCTYESAAWRCVKQQGHTDGHSPFLENGECKFESVGEPPRAETPSFGIRESWMPERDLGKARESKAGSRPSAPAPSGEPPWSVKGRLGAYLNTVVADLGIEHKGQYFRDLFAKFTAECDVYHNLESSPVDLREAAREIAKELVMDAKYVESVLRKHLREGSTNPTSW